MRDELRTEPTAPMRAAHVAAMEQRGDRAPERFRTERGREHPEAGPSRGTGCAHIAIPGRGDRGVLGLTCGLAAAGSLPVRAQRQVARVAQRSRIGRSPTSRVRRARHRRGRRRPVALIRAVPAAHRRRPPSSPSSSSTSSSTGPSTSTSTTPSGQSTPGAVTPGPAAGGAGPTPASGPATPPPTTTPAASSPGKSGAAPGHAGPGTTAVAPGKSGDAPGHNKTDTRHDCDHARERAARHRGSRGVPRGHNKDRVDGG